MVQSTSLTWEGGDAQYHAATLDAAIRKKEFNQWVESVPDNPVMISGTGMSLVPIYIMVGMADKEKVAGCRDACKAYARGEFADLEKEEEERAEREKRIKTAAASRTPPTPPPTPDPPRQTRRCSLI